MPLVLRTLNGRYDRVLGEYGIYSPHLDNVYNTLQELHCGPSYYLHLTSTTSINLLGEGLRDAMDPRIRD